MASRVRRRTRHGSPRRRGARPLSVVAALTALLALLSPSPAHAHARPVSTSPSEGAVLATAPATLTVTFNEPVGLAAAGNQVLGPDGSVLAAEFDVRDHVVTITPAAPLGDGTHVVSWRVTSSDAHPIGGAFSFSVGAPSARAPQLPDAVEHREIRLAQAIATAVQYAGVLGLAGLVALVVLVAPRSARESSALRTRWMRAGGGLTALGVGGAVCLVPLSALWEAGLPLASLWSTSTWTAGAGGAAGLSALLVAAGSAVALTGLATRRHVVAVAGGALAPAALVLVGHTRAFGPAWLVLGADLVHVAAAAFWWGGLIGLALALPASAGLRVNVRAALVARFSTAAIVVVAALVAAGLVLYWQVAHSVAGLWETPYGRAVLAKSALVVPVVAMAWWNRRRVVPLLADTAPDRAASQLLRLVRAEAGVLVGVVVTTGVLVNLTPPARDLATPPPPPAERAVTVAVGDDHEARIVLAPGRRGVNAVRVVVTDADGRPVPLDDVPTLSLLQEQAAIGPLRRPVSRTAAEVWEATVDLPAPGTWQVTLAVPLDRYDQPVATGRIEVP